MNSRQKNKKSKITFMQFLQGVEGVAIIIACYLTIFLKPLRDRWGFDPKKVLAPLPGDQLVSEPKTQFTHAIEINAPVKYVWPWIAQIGRGKGGFYSYEALENVIGLDIYNVDEILPQFQTPKVGDFVGFSPKDFYPIVIVEKERGMVIENHYDLKKGKMFSPQAEFPPNFLHLSWLWYVEPLGATRSLFISRNRVTYNSSRKTKLAFGWPSEPIVFAMDRKMCYGIKKRAERHYKAEKSTETRVP